MLLVAVVLGLLCASATAAGAHHRVLVRRDIVNEEFGYRPHAIGLSGDGSFFVYGLHWTQYGQKTASATGRAQTRGCVPNCAQGREFKPRVHLRLSRVVECGGRYIFGRLEYALHGHIPTGFRRDGTLSLLPTSESGKATC